MPTLRQQVDTFCKNSGAKVDASDKLRKQVADLKSELKKVKDHMKSMKAKTKRVKMTDEEKGQRRREKAKVRPPALAEPMLPAAAAVPVPAPSLAPAVPARGGTRRRRRYVSRW